MADTEEKLHWPGESPSIDEKGKICFLCGGDEVMRFEPEGKVFVRGEEVDDNQEVYLAFRRWLETAETQGS